MSSESIPPRVFDSPPSSLGDGGHRELSTRLISRSSTRSSFAEALEEGEISPEERHRLDLAAAALGLDPERARRLENALLHAYESHAAITLAERADPSSLADQAPPTGRPRQSGFFEGDDDRPTPVTGHAPIPDENAVLHDRFAAGRQSGNLDVQFCTAAVLVRRNLATPEQMRVYAANRSMLPSSPQRAVTTEAWGRLVHPDEDRCTGDVFAVIASAALLGRISAMRRDRSLPHLDADKRHEPHVSTVSAVRAIAWAANTLGLRTPPIFVYFRANASRSRSSPRCRRRCVSARRC